MALESFDEVSKHAAAMSKVFMAVSRCTNSESVFTDVVQANKASASGSQSPARSFGLQAAMQAKASAMVLRFNESLSSNFSKRSSYLSETDLSLGPSVQ